MCQILVVAACIWGAAALQCWAQNVGDAMPFSRTKIIIEYNATDEDVGVQVLLDGEPWKEVTLFSPDGREILDIEGQSSLRQQGLTELFFESSEPSLAEVSLAEFLARFPAGIYKFEGVTIDGIQLTGEATLSHVIPAGPVIVKPVSSNNDLPVVDPDNAIFQWKQVSETIAGSSDITIVGYQVIVEQENPRRVFSIDLPAGASGVKVPPIFFQQRNTVHKFEVLAIEAGGNQTITAGEFKTAPREP